MNGDATEDDSLRAETQAKGNLKNAGEKIEDTLQQLTFTQPPPVGHIGRDRSDGRGSPSPI